MKPPAPPEPPIHAAARSGDLPALDQLVRDGHDVNLRADLEVDNGGFLCGLTPLMVAARSLDGAGAETLRWLLGHGADLRATSEGGTTAAWYAAGTGGRWWFHEWRRLPDHVDRLRVLLDAGLPADETASNGRSLVVEAAAAGDPARLRLLLDRGGRAVPAFDLHAAAAEHARIVEAHLLSDLTAGLGPKYAREMAQTIAGPVPRALPGFALPLFVAAASGSAGCVGLLLQAGAPVDSRDAQGQTALMVAGSCEAASVLLEAGADPRAVDLQHYDVLQAVLSGADCSGPCARPVRAAIADLLVGRGVDVNSRVGTFGQSRLAAAAFARNDAAVDILLGLGARHDAPSDRSPLMSVCWQGEMTDPAPNVATERIVRALVAAGADVNERDDEGNTPLHEAAGGDWGNATAVRVLLELGATVDTRNRAGWTALMFAAERGEAECIDLLLRAGADPEPALPAARDHRDSWVHLVADAADEDTARNNRETLAVAEACLALLTAAASGRP